MSLIEIEYGSLASSETMNKNFMYLENKIAEANESLMTSISSILSNIATINARLNDINENSLASIEQVSATVESYKSKNKELVNAASMVPDWGKCVSISLASGATYTAPSNGNLLLNPETDSVGNLVINGKTLVFKVRLGGYDNSAQLVSFPVAKGDKVTCSAILSYAYFVPSKNISIANY